MASRPSVWMRFRQTMGRALRETGQALDRLGIKGETLAVSKRIVGDDPVIYEDHLSRHRHQMPLLRRGRPIVSPDAAFIAPCSTLIGSVRIGPGSSVFYKSILRADNCLNAKSFNAPTIEDESAAWELDPYRHRKDETESVGGGIFIGENTNVQDGCIIDSRKDHTKIGDGVTIGHMASIHSATIGNNTLIGMGSLIQEGCEIGEECLIAAGAVIPKNTTVEAGELWIGHPARKLRDLSTEERQKLHYQASEVSFILCLTTAQNGVDAFSQMAIRLET